MNAIEIQGFKSFPDKTRVSFDKGITAVVGPNGSGKSNISDAIRWVLGETSVKQLRGGGKMENVIFSGTQGSGRRQSRSPMGYASVQLIVDNSDRRLDIEADEVTIGRKYYRSGESEYSINGQSVRLKDVYELLLDTGLGRDGYSVIGQGRIAEIVGAKSGERREIFEEASGIARFRYRKNEAERRLASAEENLVRLLDILGELEVRVGPLKKESEKAKQYLELAHQRKSHEVTLWVDTMKEARQTLRDHQRKVEIAEADHADAGRALAEVDSQTEDVRREIEKIIMEIDRHNGEIRALQEELSGRDAHIAVLRNNIEHNDTQIASLRQEIAQSGESMGEISAQIEAHGEGICQGQAALALAGEKIAALEARLREMQSLSLATGERRGQVQAELAALTETLTNVKVRAAAAQSGSEAASQRLAAQLAESEKVDGDIAALAQQEADTRAFLGKTGEEITKLENIKGGLEMKLAARQKALQEAGEAEQAIARKAEAARARIQMLADLEKSLDGFVQSVKAVVKTAREGRLRGIIGPVSTILSVREGYEVAIETALGYALQNVVVENEGAAKAAMAFLKDTKGGRATFLPLDTVRPQQMDYTLPAGAIGAQTLVRFDARYANIVSSLLGRIVVVEDINEASRVARQLNYRCRVVTRDGQVINAGGSFTGGSVSRSAGLFSRKQEIDDLKARLPGYEAELEAARRKTDGVKAEAARLQADLTATGSELITAGGDKIRGETELARICQALSAARANREAAQGQLAETRQAIEGRAREGQRAEEEQRALENRIELLSTELAGISGEDDEFLTGREALSGQLSQLRLEALGLEKDIEAHRQAIEGLKSRTGEGEARRIQLGESIALLQQKSGEYNSQIQQAEENAGQTKEKIAAIEDNIRKKTTLRLEKEGSIVEQSAAAREIMARREGLSREIARLSEQKTALESRYDSTAAQLWDEYELSVGEAEKLCVEYDTVAELRRRVNELRGKIRALGDVNVGAIEEYQEVNERYTFLKGQVEDVQAGKAGLEKLIAELCAEMTGMFAASFEQINRNFGRIFAELFGGGRGELSLSNPEDLLESGIEIAVAPPGKIIKDLSALSGGEQALVAICIYFAILAVNPAPFCVLDEIEAALDDVNVVRFAGYLRRISDKTQFIVITHRRGTMEEADVLYGVTMQEDGVSKILRLSVADVEASLVS